ncbi:hypothetical protein OTSUT76_0131 [Orientia tsutsugamushi str. UT76]|uniref:Uncharacterized protein n=1 Tax=Orientia tsutsugamushi TaxID=784 RepID=A0A2U3R0H5_ORITS|nr:hypothetical protein OTSUT76_0131 [Orientia tsutsugamushi str. UT76]SPR06724.1 Uncharacterised protein [Orientia tsutsugamushi]
MSLEKENNARDNYRLNSIVITCAVKKKFIIILSKYNSSLYNSKLLLLFLFKVISIKVLKCFGCLCRICIDQRANA